MASGAETRLASYGTLAPGQINHQQLDGLAGHWRTGTVRGWLVEGDWGSALGFPGLILDDGAASVAVHVFESVDLPDHWDRLDAFEGESYRRDIVTVETDTGPIAAYIYVLLEP